MRRWFWSIAILAACGSETGFPQAGSGDAPPPFEPPVLLNAESPVNYPRDMFEQQVEGVVVLRLYVTAEGNVVPESTRIAEASGYPELDSAALRGVESMRFAPARRNGQPVGTLFLQPVHFRQPDRAERGGER
ncbi:MAG: hypothetical protein KatS3mg081_2316 [Gemmatimonadales bacterium]|nr:hypothetical protein HRbin33_00930 [bacterium HR33]GIW52961.1 MAG: hypothetical protein KatS3mg081_2316 [Gemmatimonadales bacterium]